MNNHDLFGNLPMPDNLDAVPVEIEDAWPQLLTDMLQVVQAAYVDQGAQPDQARELAIIALRALASYHGGRTFYLPRGDRLEQALRDARMWDEFNGKNIGDLCTRYRLTEQRVYQVLAEQRALRSRKIQPALF
jgi:Mor family transcriptional regulator